MVENLNLFLKAQDPNQVTDVFLFVTLAVAGWAVYRVHTRPLGGFTRYAPTLLTTLGIFGTFLGITIGLLQFDPSSMASIDQSMPSLLAGLKLAFFTSIFGMGASVIVKGWSLAVARARADNDTPQDDAIEILRAQHHALRELKVALVGDGDSSVITQLQRMRTDVVDSLRETRAAVAPAGSPSLAERVEGVVAEHRGFGRLLLQDLSKIASTQSEMASSIAHGVRELDLARKAIAGEDDTSVVTQLQKARTELRDGGRQLQEVMTAMQVEARKNAELLQVELRSFAEKVSELGSRALIEALSDVIRDFNQKLAEQFGDNFRRLDESVRMLVEWQDNYRQQMTDLKSALDKSVVSVEASEKALAGVHEHASSIPPLIGRLEPIITTADAQLTDLARHLDALAEVRDKARDAVPEIRQTLERSFDEMHGAVRAAGDHYQSLLAGTREFVDKFVNDMNAGRKLFDESTEEWLDIVTRTLKDGAVQMEKATRQSADSITDSVKVIAETTVGIRAELDNVLKGHREAAEKSVADFSGSMKTAHERLRDELNNLHQNQRSLIQQIGEDLRKHNEKAAADRTDLINQEIAQLDAAINQELQRVLQQMGNALGSITEKFATDYQVLTEQMQKVVGQARIVARNERAPHERSRSDG